MCYFLKECIHLLDLWLYLSTWKDPTAWVTLDMCVCVLDTRLMVLEWMDGLQCQVLGSTL